MKQLLKNTLFKAIKEDRKTVYSKAFNLKETANIMKAKERQILFIIDNIIYHRPFDKYSPGDIKEMRKKIAEELGCDPEEIRIMITGV